MRCSLRIVLVAGTISLGLTAVCAQAAGPDEEAKSAIAASLQERLVRPVPAEVIEREARNAVRSLDDRQVEALLEGEAIQNVTAQALGDPESDLLFVPVSPCRIIDTRLAGGRINPGVAQVRHFEVAGTTGFEDQGGNPGGCGIPLGAATPLAAAVVVNVVAVGPLGPGHLRAWEFGQPPPNAAIINFANVSGLNIANGVILPIAGVASLDKDLSIDGNTSATFVVADVTGYFTRFPAEQFQGGLKSSVITTQNTTLTSMADGACKELNTCTVTTESAGTVIVEAWGQFVANHTVGTLDRVAIGVETASPVVCNADDTVDVSDFELSAALGTNPDVDFTVSHGRAFTQAAGQTQTYRLSGQMISGANSGDAIENSRMICTFIPD